MNMINLTPAGCDNYTTEPAQAVLLLNQAAPLAQKLGLAIHMCHSTFLLADLSSRSSHASEDDLKSVLHTVSGNLEQVLAILHDAAKGTTQPSKVED
jgi:type IV secretory pathway VirB2 component (pilin)